MRLSDIAGETGCDLKGDGAVEITGVASIDEAEAGTITFLADPRRSGSILKSGASAFILPPGVSCDKRPFLVSANPLLAFSEVIRLFHPPPPPKGVDPRAVVESGVEIGRSVTVYPNAYIGEGAVVGDRTTIYPGAYIGPDCKIGEDTTIYANAVINEGTEIGNRVIIHGGAVIGSDGYGFIWDGSRHSKIPQVGRVVIGDDVEIGANSTIDRATLGKTEIKRGTKIDNLVMIAHNCTVGEDCLLISQSGMAGSSELGSNVIIAGQVGVAGHISIGNGAVIGGKSGVTKNIEAGARVTGYPPIPHMDWLRQQKSLEKLPEMRRRIKELVAKIEKLEKMESEDA